MDERKWIERILAGDTQSFSCLVAKYEKMAYTIALRILENREEAEEAVQDAFVKMYRALSDFHFDSKFSTWFYRIVYRTALTALRQQRMFVSYEEAGPVDLSNDEVEVPPESWTLNYNFINSLHNELGIVPGSFHLASF